MKWLFSLATTFFLILLLMTCPINDNTPTSYLQNTKLASTSASFIPLGQTRGAEFELTVAKQSTGSNHEEKSTSVHVSEAEPSSPTFEATKESGLVKGDDDALSVRILESPEIDTKLSLCAVLISFLALFISFMTVCLQIKHNHDEVRPILAIHLDINNMSIKIKNHGVGPAIFYRWNGKKQKVKYLPTR